MTVAAEGDLVEAFHQANQRLQFWLESLALSVAPGAPMSSEQISELFSELANVGAWLRPGLPDCRSPELEREIQAYRRRVEWLRQLLPAIHRNLLLERARLEREYARVETAAEWARRSRQTL